MNLNNFRFETDADGIATVDLGHARPLDERHHAGCDGRARRRSSTSRVRRGDQGLRDHLGQGSVLRRRRPRRCCRAARCSCRAGKEPGEEAAMQRFFDESRAQRACRELETCGKPFAAAINGICLGGAFELALACHYRVVGDERQDALGLPEIKVGLFPGGGGTQRVSAPDADRRRAADAVQGRADHGPAGAKAREPRRMRSSPRDQLDRRRRTWHQGGGKAVSSPGTIRSSSCRRGRSIPPAGHADLAAGNAIYRRETYDNYPAPRDSPRQRLRGPAAADGRRRCRSRSAISPRSCARRKRRR